MLKFLKIIVFAVGTYYILQFVIRLYNARKKANANSQPEKKQTTQSAIKKPMVNPEAGEYTDYEELKD